MSLCKASNETKPYVFNNQIGKVYKGSTLIYSAESDVIVLTGTVEQGSNEKNWGYFDYEITEDWEKLTVVDSKWGKSFGEFETSIQLIDGSTTSTLVRRAGAYGGHTMPEEPIVATGTQYAVKKGQTIRLAIGVSYYPNVSDKLGTTSWFSFVLS